MNNIEDFDYSDGEILRITLGEEQVELIFERWNAKQIKIIFEEYWRIKDNHSIGQSIGALTINSSREIIEEIKTTVKTEPGDEVDTLNVFAFESSWDDMALFEIAARNAKVEELYGE